MDSIYKTHVFITQLWPEGRKRRRASGHLIFSSSGCIPFSAFSVTQSSWCHCFEICSDLFSSSVFSNFSWFNWCAWSKCSFRNEELIFWWTRTGTFRIAMLRLLLLADFWDITRSFSSGSMDHKFPEDKFKNFAQTKAPVSCTAATRIFI